MGNSINEAIQNLYDEPLETSELQEASRNLIGLFELLIEIDQQQQRESKKND
jgi:hypothetical protein